MKPSRTLLVAMACLSVPAGCDGGETSVDAGADGASEDAGRGVELPDIPWADAGAPVVMTPCPDGWREWNDGEVTQCAPYPEAGPETCPFGEAHFPGESGCRPLGDPCPVGRFAEGLSTDGPIHYVDPEAPAGGDGSLDAPFQRLAQVPWLSASGATIALSKGRHGGQLPLPAGTRVIGACAAETIVTGSDGPFRSVASVTSAGEPALLRNLTFENVPHAAVEVDDGHAIAIEGVGFRRIPDIAIAAIEGSHIVASDVAMYDVYDGSGGGVGEGLHLEGDSRIEATRVIVERAAAVGAWVGIGSTLVLTEAALLDVRPATVNTASPSMGAFVWSGGRLEMSRAMISGVEGNGILARDPETVVILSDLRIEDTTTWRTDGTAGIGVRINLGSRGEARRVVAARSHGNGIHVDATSELMLEDALVEDTRIRPEDPPSSGTGLSATGTIRASRVHLRRNAGYGISAWDEALVVAEDVLIREVGVRGEIAPQSGPTGISVLSGARLELSRAVVTNHASAGIIVWHRDDTGSRAASATLTDTFIGDVEGWGAEEPSGRGIQVQNWGEVEGSRVRVEGATGLGVAALGGSDLSLSHLTVAGARPTPCEGAECMSLPAGMAVAAVSGSVAITDFALREATSCGVIVADMPRWTNPTALDLSAGTVADSGIGACIQVEGYDTTRLTEGVRYLDNAVNLDVTMLPVPMLPPDP